MQIIIETQVPNQYTVSTFFDKNCKAYFVHYGKQVFEFCNFQDAIREHFNCVYHALECNGELIP